MSVANVMEGREVVALQPGSSGTSIHVPLREAFDMARQVSEIRCEKVKLES